LFVCGSGASRRLPEEGHHRRAAGRGQPGSGCGKHERFGDRINIGAGARGGGPGGGPNASVGRIIYFDFDKSDIRPEFAAVVSGNAQFLAAHPNAKLKLEGNTDERGTREYNIGLGERRAQAVRRALMLQGASESQLTTVSFGAERPAAEGDDEAAWAKNRRVELVYGP
jgi:peptidoglycan-associated lipoprotein